jgi:hypothetical protein
MSSGFFYAKYFQSLILLPNFEIAEKGGYFFSCWGINKGNQVQGTLRCLAPDCLSLDNQHFNTKKTLPALKPAALQVLI